MKHAFLHQLSEYRSLNGKDLESFYDHDWAKELFGEFRNGPLHDAIFGLCASLKSAAIVHSYPILIAKLVKSGIGGALDKDGARLAKDLDRFSYFISSEISPTPHQSTKIEEALGVVKLANANAKCLSMRAAEDQIWNEICNFQHQTLVIATTGALRLVFNGLFFAMENFCKDCCSLVLGNDDFIFKYRSKKAGTIDEIFGSSIYDSVLGGYIDVARQVRNALTHRGGKVPSDMFEVVHGFQVVDGEFVIVPEDNRKLFNEIMARTLLLAEVAIKKKQRHLLCESPGATAGLSSSAAERVSGSIDFHGLERLVEEGPTVCGEPYGQTSIRTAGQASSGTLKNLDGVLRSQVVWHPAKQSFGSTQ